MSDSILRCLARHFWRCPFDQELFDSDAALSRLLLESHLAELCQRKRIPKQKPLGDIEMPLKLTFCGHCGGNMVPDTLGRNAISEISRHIEDEHPNPFGPAQITMTTTSDPDLIAQFVNEQVSSEVFECSEPGCAQWLSSETAVVAHWIDKHCLYASVEDVRRLLETAPERCDAALEECLAAQDAENRRHTRMHEEQDDGYRINHYPDVPRVRSRPSEVIVFIEREKVRLREEDLREMLAVSGAEDGSEPVPEEPWKPQEIRLELRFCNIHDGYVPMVEDIRRILPPLTDGAEIEVSWQDEPSHFFPCKVSKTKRAIYNLDRKRREKFAGLPAGVALYVKRVGRLRYEFRLNPKLHTVRNCKVFVADGQNGWKIEVRDLEEEWETGNAVFRHQSTFDSMEALHAEANITNLSIRDAVYELMKRLPQNTVISTREVYDAVFWRLRTCSEAAVWSQFRLEHECYVPVGAGLYRFDASTPLPRVRIVHIDPTEPRHHPNVSPREGRSGNSMLLIKVKWAEILKQPRSDEVFSGDVAAENQALFIASLIREFGEPMVARLKVTPVSGRYPLSDEPLIDFSYGNGSVYNHTQVPGTDLYLHTNTDNVRKQADILHLASILRFPPGSVKVELVKPPTREDMFRAMW